MSTCPDNDGACPHAVVYVSRSGHPLCKLHAVAEQAQLISTFARCAAENGDLHLLPLIDDAHGTLSTLLRS